jgi:hypothetical protein
MKNHNPTNERVKRRYFAYLAEAQGHSEPTIDAVAKAIARFETFTRCRDFSPSTSSRPGRSSETLLSNGAIGAVSR